MKLYRTGHSHGRIANVSYVEHEGLFYRVPIERWDDLVNHPDLAGYLVSLVVGAERAEEFDPRKVLAPLESQSVWAAGVTSPPQPQRAHGRSQRRGGGDFYDRVYTAKRPELFFKAGPELSPGPASMYTFGATRSGRFPSPS